MKDTGFRQTIEQMDSKDNLYVVENPKKKTIFDYTAEYLFEKYDIRYNEISHDYEISLKEENNWHILNVNSLIIELAKVSIDVTPKKLEIFIKSDWIEKHNPIQNYFNSLPIWNGTDYIKKYCSYVPIFEDEAFLYHFRKWLVRTVRCALEPEYFNKQAFIISHRGQSSGKSTWCRFLCPPRLSAYMAEDISNDKDARIQLSRNFLLNLDELA
ncbi:MAG: VapE domain-containing protein, partial [Flavobacteriaceae bacterium]